MSPQSSPTLSTARAALRAHANPAQAKNLARFFKTAKGEYAEGDRFLGVMVPTVRIIAREYANLSLPSIERLLQSRYNEERLLALVIMIRKFQKGDEPVQRAITRVYLRNLKHVNNWNLVDISAPRILGHYLLKRPRALLRRLSRSPNLWQRRVAVLTTFQFIAHGDYADSLALANALLTDNHDLIHKACGWMLREIGKRDVRVLEKFLRKNCRRMPRTMLRYSIERLPERKRRAYLSGNV